MLYLCLNSIFLSNYLLANFRGLALGWTRSRMDGWMEYRIEAEFRNQILVGIGILIEKETRWKALDEIYQNYMRPWEETTKFTCIFWRRRTDFEM